MKKKLALLLAGVMTLSMGMTACTPKPVEDGSDGAVRTEYKQTYSGEITTLNYMTTGSENDQQAVASFVDTLVEYDKYGIIQPCLATEWSASEDGMVWTLKLRPEAKWYTYDGTEYADVVADDFVAAAEWMLNSDNASPMADMLYYLVNGEEYFEKTETDFTKVGVKAIDEKTLEYTLKQPTPYFLSMLSYASYLPVNRAFLAEQGDRFGTENTRFLYNGAYLMETWEAQSKRVYVKNEKYWDKDKIFIEKLVHNYNKESATLAPELFLRGETDYADIPSSIIGEWLADPAKADQVRPVKPNAYSYFYTFNFDPQFAAEYEPENWKVVVNNINFRKAMFHALDKEKAMLTSEPYDPKSKLAETVTPPDFVDFDGKDFVNMGGLKALTEGTTFDAKKAVEYKAKAMEELAGKATFPVKVLMPYNAGGTEWTQRVQVVEQQMEELLGKDFIDIISEGRPATGFLKDTRRSGNYAFLECNWGPDYADPETYTGPFVEGASYLKLEAAEDNQDPAGGTIYHNMARAANAETTDIGKRYEMFADTEAHLINQAYIIPFCRGGFGYVASRVSPFESQFSPFGVSGLRYKGQKVYEKAMNTEEYQAGLAKWEEERAQAIKDAAK